MLCYALTKSWFVRAVEYQYIFAMDDSEAIFLSLLDEILLDEAFNVRIVARIYVYMSYV